jgi:hypothetical protein
MADIILPSIVLIISINFIIDYRSFKTFYNIVLEYFIFHVPGLKPPPLGGQL